MCKHALRLASKYKNFKCENCTKTVIETETRKNHRETFHTGSTVHRDNNTTFTKSAPDLSKTVQGHFGVESELFFYARNEHSIRNILCYVLVFGLETNANPDLLSKN